MHLMLANDVNGLDASPNVMEPEAALSHIAAIYTKMHQSGVYGPSKQSAVSKHAAMNAQITQQVQSQVQTALKQQRDASSTKGNSGQPGGQAQQGCFKCGGNHLKRDCPQLNSTPDASGDATVKTSNRPTTHGLDDATSLKVGELSRAKLGDMGPRGAIPDDAKHDISIGGVIMAKYCRHCGRFGKGANAHYTSEHKGTRQFPYDANAPSDPPPSLASNMAGAAPTGLTNVTTHQFSDYGLNFAGNLSSNVARVSGPMDCTMTFLPDTDDHPFHDSNRPDEYEEDYADPYDAVYEQFPEARFDTMAPSIRVPVTYTTEEDQEYEAYLNNPDLGEDPPEAESWWNTLSWLGKGYGR